jgi:AbrB family looped-hinge helix DNA binding protein
MLRTTTITRKGQITIPVEIRSALGLVEGDTVEFELEDSTVLLRARPGNVIERTKGAVKSERPAMTAEELRIAGETAIAEDVMERARR